MKPAKAGILFFLGMAIAMTIGYVKVIRPQNTTAPVPDDQKKCKIISHRGISQNAPENTIAAITQSVALGADAVEIDVRSAKDGHLILMHDSTVNRTTNGKGKVAQMTLQHIRTLDAGSWKDSKFASQKVPLLHEALDLLNVSGKIAVIDIKDPAAVDKIVMLVAEKAMTGRIVIIGFNPDILKSVASLDNNIQRAWLCRDFPAKAITPAQQAKWLSKKAAEYNVQIVNLDYTLISEGLIKRLHKKNIKVWAWTVNHSEIANQLIKWKIDAITTDKPELLIKITDSNQKQ